MTCFSFYLVFTLYVHDTVRLTTLYSKDLLMALVPIPTAHVIPLVAISDGPHSPCRAKLYDISPFKVGLLQIEYAMLDFRRRANWGNVQVFPH